MELLLVLIIALILLKPSDVVQLAKLLGHFIALKHKSRQRLEQFIHEAVQHTAMKNNSQHDNNS